MISKDRNFSSYNNYSIPRFLHGQILFDLDNPDRNPAERKTISNPNPKKSKYPAGLDSKIRILYTTGLQVTVDIASNEISHFSYILICCEMAPNML